MNKIISFLLAIFFISHANAQTSEFPIVGKPFPNFLLENVQYYTQNKVSLEDFRGKWLILDFWNEHCPSCISSFPKMDLMQKEFGEKIQIMLVGFSGSWMDN